MADNVITDAGAGGETFATDDIAGIQYPISKITFGALNSQTLASSGNGTTDAGTQRVTISSDTTGVLSVDDNGGSLTVDNGGTFATQATLQAGTAAFGKLAANSGVDIGDVDVTTYPGPADAKFATLGQKAKAGAMPVTLSSDEDALNVIATNAGTFVVQSTLQAGTAEFGKLAAGVAEIGNVKNSGTFVTQATLQAGTAEIGKLAAGTAAIGKLAANSGVDIGDVDVTSIAAGSNLIGDVGIGVRTSGGIPIDSIYYDSDLDETAIAAKASAGQMYFIHAMNTTAAALFLQIWNVAQGSVTVGTTTPDMQFIIPGNADSDGAGFTINFATPIDFDVAITVACTTNSEGNGAPGAGACHVNIGIN